MSEQAQKKIAVIGAGIAGLSCATRLQALGHTVEVFEKSRGPSGRMSTRQGEDWAADHGAQYFTARDPLFIQTLESWIASGDVSLWNPNLGVFENGQWRKSNSLDHRYVANPGMNGLGKKIASQLVLHANQTIDQLIFSDHQWQISSKELGNITTTFDVVILAIPAPQAHALTKTLPIQISTEMNGLYDQINMDGCWTVMARFHERPHFPFDAAFVNGEIISWICRNQSKPNREGKESWAIHATPQWSQENIEAEPEAASVQLLECAKKLGLHCQLAEISTHRWRYASGHISPSPEYILLPHSNIGLCGDWLNGGRVEGAWLSGRKLADAIGQINSECASG